jgi:hypothetical protein
MVEWMLSNIICSEFEKAVGKRQAVSRKAMHIGFSMRPSKSSDQYHVVHMYIFAPMNYAYVATQSERITDEGDRVVGPMELLSYHDSCWRDAVQSFIFEHRGDLNTFNSFKLLEWHDVITLTSGEIEYLDQAERWRRDHFARRDGKKEETCPLANPFDSRGIWAGKV